MSVVGEWLDIGPVDQLPALGARTLPVRGGEEIAIFHTATGDVYALVNKCPHKQGPLSQGIVFGETVACPLHNWSIGLADGCAKSPDVGCTVPFTVKVEAGRVHLDSTELATLALDLLAPKSGPGASTGALGDASFDVQAPHTA